MSRGLTWAATSVPEIRRQWCNALDATAERHSEPLLEPPSGPAAKRIERMQEKNCRRNRGHEGRSGRPAQRGALLVARNMVEAAVGACINVAGCYVTGLAKRQSLSVA